jgi:hypothetical protein
MKKCVLFFLCVLLLCGFISPLWAGIGDNFQASSLILGGSMSFKMDKENLDVDTDDFQLFQLNPSFGLFVADGLSVFFYPSVRYQRGDGDYYTFSTGYDYYKTMQYGVSLGLNYYIPLTAPSSPFGPVLSLGAGLGMRISSGTQALNEGEKLIWDDPYKYIDLSGYIDYYFFLTERVAPYLEVVPGYTMMLGETPVKYFEVTAKVGIAFFLPSRQMSLVGR